MGTFISSDNEKNRQDNNIELDQEQVLLNQLTSYITSLEKNQANLQAIESSFLPVARSFIINTMGKNQCESYKIHNSFTKTELNIMKCILRIPYFDVDKHNEVKHLIDPLKKSFEIGKLIDIENTIRTMKNIRVYQGNSFATIDYQLLDILEYISKICQEKKYDPLNHWTHIFDILFRGTNIKLSNRKSFKDNKMTKDIILFHCHSQNSSFNRHQNIKLSNCYMTVNGGQDEKEIILQSQSIVSNKIILDDLIKVYDTNQDFFPIHIQLAGYVGYLYSIRKYKGIFVASQVCESKIYIPRTIEEFHTFLYHDHVLEILCNLKRHYVNIAKIIRHASVST